MQIQFIFSISFYDNLLRLEHVKDVLTLFHGTDFVARVTAPLRFALLALYLAISKFTLLIL